MMGNSNSLKKYLIDDGYLFNHHNNGNVIMLSGVWGAGKTHFWKNTIEPELKKLSEQKKHMFILAYMEKKIFNQLKMRFY